MTPSSGSIFITNASNAVDNGCWAWQVLQRTPLKKSSDTAFPAQCRVSYAVTSVHFSNLGSQLLSSAIIQQSNMYYCWRQWEKNDICAATCIFLTHLQTAFIEQFLRDFAGDQGVGQIGELDVHRRLLFANILHLLHHVSRISCLSSKTKKCSFQA